MYQPTSNAKDESADDQIAAGSSSSNTSEERAIEEASKVWVITEEDFKKLENDNEILKLKMQLEILGKSYKEDEQNRKDEIIRKIKWKKWVGVANSRQFWHLKRVESRVGILFSLFSKEPKENSSKKQPLSSLQNKELAFKEQKKKLRKNKMKAQLAKLKDELAIRTMDDLHNYRRNELQTKSSEENTKRSEAVIVEKDDKITSKSETKNRNTKYKSMVKRECKSGKKNINSKEYKSKFKQSSARPKAPRMKYSVRGYVKKVPVKNPKTPALKTRKEDNSVKDSQPPKEIEKNISGRKEISQKNANQDVSMQEDRNPLRKFKMKLM